MYISFSSHLHLALILLVHFSTDRHLLLNTLWYLYCRCLTHWTNSHTPTTQKICVQKLPANRFLKLTSFKIEHLPSYCFHVNCPVYISFCPKAAPGSTQEPESAKQRLAKLSGRQWLKMTNHQKNKIFSLFLDFSLWLRYPFQRVASLAFGLNNDEGGPSEKYKTHSIFDLPFNDAMYICQDFRKDRVYPPSHNVMSIWLCPYGLKRLHRPSVFIPSCNKKAVIHPAAVNNCPTFILSETHVALSCTVTHLSHFNPEVDTLLEYSSELVQALFQ